MKTLRKHGKGNKRWLVYMWTEVADGGDPRPEIVEVLAPTSDEAEDLALSEHGHFDTYSAEPLEETHGRN